MAKMTKETTRKPGKCVGEVCLYGGRETGAGWIAAVEVRGRTVTPTQAFPATAAVGFGDGEPDPRVGLTDAVYRGIRDVLALCEVSGIRVGVRDWVWVHAPGGERRAKTPVFAPGYFGGLAWEPGVVYEIPMEAILAAATAEEGRR